MFDHTDLDAIQRQSLRMQSWVRKQTFSPSAEKTLRREGNSMKTQVCLVARLQMMDANVGFHSKNLMSCAEG